MEKSSTKARATLSPSPRSPTSGPPVRPALARDPLSPDDIIERLYRPEAPPVAPPADSAHSMPAVLPKPPRPTHYKIVCISLYTEDITRLQDHVRELKRRGHSKANKSQVIREALLQLDLDKVPRAH